MKRYFGREIVTGDFDSIQDAEWKIPDLPSNTPDEYFRSGYAIARAREEVLAKAVECGLSADDSDFYSDIRIHPAEGDISYGESVPGVIRGYFSPNYEIDKRWSNLIRVCANSANNIPVSLICEACGADSLNVIAVLTADRISIGAEDQCIFELLLKLIEESSKGE